ncbi:MAG: HNH endonuclease, partial [Myxococcota bacterium]
PNPFPHTAVNHDSQDTLPKKTRVTAFCQSMTVKGSYVALSKVEVLARYDATVRSARNEHALPAVIRLMRRVSWRKLGIRFSRHHVYKRDAFTCQYCNTHLPASKLTLDHVVPRSAGGPTSWTNIVTSCVDCNQLKADHTPEQAGMQLTRKPYAPYWMQLSVPNRDNSQAAELWKPYLWH